MKIVLLLDSVLSIILHIYCNYPIHIHYKATKCTLRMDEWLKYIA